MSDTSNLTSDANEPSMEDILSSIRKVIAQETAKPEMVEAETVIQETIVPETVVQEVDIIDPLEIPVEVLPETSAEIEVRDVSSKTLSETPNAMLEDILELEEMEPIHPEGSTAGNSLVDDVLELEVVAETSAPSEITNDEAKDVLELLTLDNELVVDNALTDDLLADNGENKEAITLEESLRVLNNPPSETGFDASLDLVMDSDASDYVTTKLDSKEMEIEDWRTQAQTDHAQTDQVQTAPEVTSSVALIDPMEGLLDDLSIPEPEAPASEIFKPETFEPTDAQDIEIADKLKLSSVDIIAPQENTAEDVATEETIDFLGADEVTTVQASPDDDMDLVKSLLADLMDEPPTEVNVDASTLERTIDGAGIVDISLEAADATLEIETLEIDAIVEQDVEPEQESPQQESTLAQLARELTEQEVKTAVAEEAINPDDIIELPAPNLVSKLALVTGAATATGAALAATSSADKTEPVQGIETSDEEIPDIATTTSTNQEAPIEEPPIEELQSQKEDTMAKAAKAAKAESLTDAGTQEEAGNAFASLTSAVQEKNLKNENGPAIGELVKEALKPMLQEWLDKNLKAMVQRAVTAEIKRISSGK